MDKFCILTRQRSGSMLLVDLLNSHPDVVALRELFISDRKVNNSVEKTGSVLRYFEYRKKTSLPRPMATLSYMRNLDKNFSNMRDLNDTAPKVIGFKIMYGQIKKVPEILISIVFQKYKGGL